MSTQDLSFPQEDITTIFDALQGFSPEELASALVCPKAVLAGKGKREGRKPSLRLAERRVASMLHTLFELGPNYEASSRIVLPWMPSHLSQLSCLSWADALGVRIVMPSGTSRATQSRFLAQALANISYV